MYQEPNANAGSPGCPAILLNPSGWGSILSSARRAYWPVLVGETWAVVTLSGALSSSRARARVLPQPRSLSQVTPPRCLEEMVRGRFAAFSVCLWETVGWKAEREGLRSHHSGRARLVCGSCSVRQAFSAFLLISISNRQLVNSSLEIRKFM